MSRTFAIAAILALSSLATQAETLEDQVHAAATKACAARHVDAAPAFFYNTLTQNCIEQLTSVSLHKLEEQARAKTLASTASAN